MDGETVKQAVCFIGLLIVEKQMDSQVDRKTDRQMDRRMDRQKER